MKTILAVCILWIISIYIEPSDGCASNNDCTGPNMSGSCRFGECQCDPKFHNPNGLGCQKCNCDDTTTMPGSCRKNGDCYCYQGHFLDKNNKCQSCCIGSGGTGVCNYKNECICLRKFYNKQDGRECQPCNCNDNGMNGECYWNGECKCKTGYFYKKSAGNNNGVCEACNCNGKGATGICFDNGDCECKPGFTGEKCKTCEFGYRRVGDDCIKCHCSGQDELPVQGLTGGCDSSGNCTTCDCNGQNMNGYCNRDGTCRCYQRHYLDGPVCKKCPCTGNGMSGNCDGPNKCECKLGHHQVGQTCPKCDCNDQNLPDDCVWHC